MQQIEAQIASFGQNILTDLDVTAQNLTQTLESNLTSEQTLLTTDSSGLRDALTAHTTTAIENIINAREYLETQLDEA